jgi:hypothetical protein
MEKRINLFKKGEELFKFDKLVKSYNMYGLGTAVLLLIIFILMSLINLKINLNKENLTQEKTQLTKKLEEDTSQFKLNYISSKTEQIKLYSKDDAHFNQYYDMIRLLFESKAIPQFSNFNINNKQILTLKFDLGTYEELLNVLRFVESNYFLNHFQNLRINSITSGSVNKNESTQRTNLEISGTIKDAITTF